MVKCAWFSCVRVEDGKIKRTLNYCEEKGCHGEFKNRYDGKLFCRNFIAVEDIQKIKDDKNDK